MKIQIKPLSVNDAYKGRKFKTNDYKLFEQEFYYSLPDMEIPEGKLQVFYTFGLSSKIADYDNPIKTCQDVLQKRYGFNDSRIYKGTIEKVDVKKGCEFIDFKIESYNI